MKLFFIFFSLIVSANALAIKSHLTCSASGTDIYFINGINIGEDEYQYFTEAVIGIEQSSPMPELDNKINSVRFIPLHNTSQGFKKDVAEAMFQYIEGVKRKKIIGVAAIRIILPFLMNKSYKMKQICNQELQQDERYICDELVRIRREKFNTHLYEDLGKFRVRIAKSVAENKKIVIVGHSQGALFADSLRTYIKKYHPAHDQYTSSLLIGAFKPAINKRTYYYNFTDDGVVNGVRSTLAIIPEQRYKIDVACEGEPDPVEGEFSYRTDNHSFDCYTGSNKVTGPKFLLESSREDIVAREYFYDLLKKAVSEHGNNDENCCNKEAGKLDRANQQTPVSEFFIGDKVELEQDLQLSHIGKNEICGNSTLSGTVSLTRSSLRDTVVTAANNNGVILIDSKVSKGASLLGNLIVRNANVKSGEFLGSHRPGYVYSEIAYGDFEGSNNFSGHFIVRGSTKNSTIAGQSLLMTNYGSPHFTLTVESLPNSGVRNGIQISGIGYINATVGARSKIHGTPLLRNTNCPSCGNWFGGVITHNANTEISSDLMNPSSSVTEVRGGIFLGNNVKIRNGSYVAGTGMRLDKGVPAIHLNSIIDASNITGGFYITSAQVLNSNVSGIPYVCTSVLDGASVTGNAVTCSGTYTGSYGSNWICNAYDEEGNTSFPTQCAIDDGTFKNESGNYTALSEEDLIQNASLLQSRSQELSYQEALATMEEMGI